MEFAIKSATEASAMYTSESFKVNRSLYEDEEAMCTVLENVIWVGISFLFYCYLFYFRPLFAV